MYYEAMQELQNRKRECVARYNAYLDGITREKVKVLVDQLVEMRKEKGITQHDIAESTGMMAPNIARIEGCKSIPTLNVLIKYADVLGQELEIRLVPKNR